MTDTVRRVISIAVHPYLADHRFEGRPVLPAVEAVQVLAEAVRDFRPDTDIGSMTAARFDKFLYIQPGSRQIAARAELAVHANGDVTAGLLTKHRSAKAAITRIKEHAAICFPRMKPKITRPPVDRIFVLAGKCMEIPADAIYRELVPFGPAYHNICDRVQLSETGALAKIAVPAADSGGGSTGQLGSPFALDAAFHAACVWGQRYARTVAFPIGFEQRVVFQPTQPGQAYFSRITPVDTSRDLMIFDIRIYDPDGELFEAVSGVHMRDVSAGRMKPPGWIMADDQKGVAIAH